MYLVKGILNDGGSSELSCGGKNYKKLLYFRIILSLQKDRKDRVLMHISTYLGRQEGSQLQEKFCLLQHMTVSTYINNSTPCFKLLAFPPSFLN